MSANTMPLQDQRSTFLLLPLELRLDIYEYLFLCKKEIHPYCSDIPRAERSISPSILRTCKQIRQEASPILYSKNAFSIACPEVIFPWLRKMGRANIKLLNTIYMWVNPVMRKAKNRAKETGLWYKILDLLAREATGLRHLEVHWNRSFQGEDAGKDLRFVRKLAKIQGLKSMVVGGYYAMHWPQYLTKKMGVAVVETIYKDEARIRGSREFQEGTEDLIP